MKRAFSLTLAVTVLCGGLLVACGGDDSDGGGSSGSSGSSGSGQSGSSGSGGSSSAAEAKFSVIYETIFAKNKRCNSSQCHGGAESLKMSTAAEAYEQLVGRASTEIPGKTRVVAGDSEASLLYQVLLAEVSEGGRTVGKMPEGSSSLTAAEIALIKKWIDDGAKDD